MRRLTHGSMSEQLSGTEDVASLGVRLDSDGLETVPEAELARAGWLHHTPKWSLSPLPARAGAPRTMAQARRTAGVMAPSMLIPVGPDVGWACGSGL